MNHITKGSVFDDLGFTSEESESLKIKASLMNTIDAELVTQNLTQVEAARLFGVAQPRVSDLIRGKIQNFTIDCLVEMLTKLNKPVRLVVDDRMVA